jgi:hypothetical protein
MAMNVPHDHVHVKLVISVRHKRLRQMLTARGTTHSLKHWLCVMFGRSLSTRDVNTNLKVLFGGVPTVAIRTFHVVDAMHGQYDRMHAEHLKVFVEYCEVIKLYNDQRKAQDFNLFIYILLPYMFWAFF